MRPFLSLLLKSSGLVIIALSLASAKGRQPEEVGDNYPDYNKLDMRRKPAADQPPAPTEPAAQPGKPAASTNILLPPPPGAEDDTAPKPPPKPVYIPDDASEPPMPEDIRNTLIQGTTAQ